MGKTIRQLQQNVKRARTVHEREQIAGETNLSIRQTRRMYFAAQSLARATGELQRALISYEFQHGRKYSNG